jgi:hypothetical protein
VLSPHLTADNAADLLQAAFRQSKRAIERIVAARFPAPDAPTVLRKIPDKREPEVHPSLPVAAGPAPRSNSAPPVGERSTPQAVRSTGVPPVPAPARRCHDDAVHPVSADRFTLQLTVNASVVDKLRRAQALLSHRHPSGNMETVLEAALDGLIEDLEAKRFGRLRRAARPSSKAGSANRPAASGKPKRRSRHLPAAIRREVISRDGARCSFVGPDGRRCGETRTLEFHHIVPWAKGGGHATDNVTAMCRVHNQFLAREEF